MKEVWEQHNDRGTFETSSLLSDINFDGTPTSTDVVPNLDLNIGEEGNFASPGRSNHIAAKFYGHLYIPNIPVAGAYTFHLTSDDGSKLLLDGNE